MIWPSKPPVALVTTPPHFWVGVNSHWLTSGHRVLPTWQSPYCWPMPWVGPGIMINSPSLIELAVVLALLPGAARKRNGGLPGLDFRVAGLPARRRAVPLHVQHRAAAPVERHAGEGGADQGRDGAAGVELSRPDMEMDFLRGIQAGVGAASARRRPRAPGGRRAFASLGGTRPVISRSAGTAAVKAALAAQIALMADSSRACAPAIVP